MATTSQSPRSQLELIEERLFENLEKRPEFNPNIITRLKKLSEGGYLSNISKVEQIIKAYVGGRDEAN
jgi:hypothetical protein